MYSAQDKKIEKFDVIIVFGEGPVKPILTPSELSSEQKAKWESFKTNPLRTREPNFYVIEEETYLEELDKIASFKDLIDSEKAYLLEEKRQEWQHTGHFALKKWGKQNALASAFALYLGMTKRLIVSGGKTRPEWAKEILPKERLQHWPSEAELMKDIIVRNYGKLYFEKFGKSIEKSITIEDVSTNTLENFAYSMNKNPEMFENMKVGFLSARHHLKRISLLAHIFSLQGASESLLSAEDLLKKVELQRNKEYFADNSDFDFLQEGENRWIKALQDPEYLTYWFGYLAEVKNPKVLQKALSKLYDPVWFEKAQKAFVQIGLPIEEFRNKDLVRLSQNNPQKYFSFIEGLRKMKKPQYRKLPPL